MSSRKPQGGNPRSGQADLALCLALGAGLVGCGASFDPASELTGLRVLAVHKSQPYATPGEVVDLQLLWHDPRPDRPAPQVAWLAFCENPPGDLFQGCFTQAPDLSADELSERVSLPMPGAELVNDRFSFRTASDIISSRPPPPEASTPRYGLHYVFFAACAGQLELDTSGEQLPFVCYEERDELPGFTAGDVQLDSRDLVVGYTAVFVYDELTNQNPEIMGVELNGTTLWPSAAANDAPAGAVLLGAPDLCIGTACAPPPREEDSASCPEPLTLPACAGDCDEVELSPLIEPSSAELDVAASSRSSEMLEEQMWVNYYSAGGEVSEEVRLLNDATVGWNDDFATDYQPSDAAGVSYVWAVAHDNRGGAGWVRLRICTE